MAVREHRSQQSTKPSPQRLVPTLKPPTLEEIERRTVLIERGRAIREAIGPVDIRADELKHLTRVESEVHD